MFKPELKASRLLYPLVGGVCGVLYVFLDEGVLDELPATASPFILVLHEFLDAILPILLGVCIGIGIHILKKLSRLNQRLSLKNYELERDLLFSTLISQMLHEIRNPVHNLMAALEEGPEHLTDEKSDIIRRNLERLEALRKQYGEWSGLFEKIDPTQATNLKPWLEQFVEDKLNGEIREEGIRFSMRVEPVRVFIHPLLLEQCLLTLFGNACDALKKLGREKRSLDLLARSAAGKPALVEIKISNGSGLFPEEVLDAQGRRPVKSLHGFGLGLLLANKTLEQVGGKMSIANEAGQAAVTLHLPGERA